METVLIDEREFIEKFVEKAQKTNKDLIDYMNSSMKERGVNPNCYVGGLQGMISSEKMTLEQNINNMFAAFISNYTESIFYQVDNIVKISTLEFIHNYLFSKGLIDDFQKYKEMAERKRLN